jgi:hypothetical protein
MHSALAAGADTRLLKRCGTWPQKLTALARVCGCGVEKVKGPESVDFGAREYFLGGEGEAVRR